MKYDRDKIIPDVLERISAGESLVSACKANGMKWPTWFDWMKEVEGLSDRYAHARELQAEHYADEIVNISDTCKDPQKARLQVDARKWVASKLLPKKYGDKLDLTSGNRPLPAAIIQVYPDAEAKEGGAQP